MEERGPYQAHLTLWIIYGDDSMRPILLLFAFLFCMLTACSSCKDYDCTGGGQLTINFVSEKTGADLIGGDNPQISETNLYCYVEDKAGDIKQRKISISWGKVRMYPDYEKNTYYFSTLGRTDTITMEFSSIHGNCCGTTHYISSLRVNGSEVECQQYEDCEVVLTR